MPLERSTTVLTHGDNAGRLAYYESMQVRHIPPHVRVLDDRSPPLRLTSASPRPANTPPGWNPLRSFNSYSVRAVAGVLLVSIPISIVLGFVMSNWIGETAIGQAKAQSMATAQAASARINDWVGERKAELRALADDSVGSLDKPWFQGRLLAADGSHPTFHSLQVFDTKGKVVASTRPGIRVPGAPTGTAFLTSLDYATLGQIQIADGELDWLMTAPVRSPNGISEGMVMGDLRPSALGALLSPFGDQSLTRVEEVHLVNAQHLLVYSSGWGVLVGDASVLAKGTLKVPAEGAIFDHAVTAGPGATEMVDYRNHRVLAGYEPIPTLGWVVIASTDSATALAPVYDMELRTSLLQALSKLLLIGMAILLAILAMRPIA